ncbi:type-F conjugative transfer system pilin assembly thiol-disulfide isomerase TrbB (plasmid) [Legionella sp. D16C41]|uniref:type-F conjugative transfer system pilin assembly thiol-disulfide isomerase TrbB n=1 Tax=Legionella sp. D16C41 TaxID=3402688 RepID=UPI003AF7E4A9
MIRLRLIVLLFWGACLSVYAGQAQWLTQMIHEHEDVMQTKRIGDYEKKEKGFFSNHGLILFYGSLCPHCREFAPILKRWADHHQAEVLPLAFDNQPLPEFPTFLPASTEWTNAAFGGNAIHYPALFLVNSKTNVLYPVGFGSMTDDELNGRMAALITKIKAYENKGKVQ